MSNHLSVAHEYLEKIEKVEKELLKLKKGQDIMVKKPISLRGILKDVNISFKEIEEAKKGLTKIHIV